MPAAPPSLLGTYLAAVCGLGLAALVGVVALTSWPSVAHGAWWPIGFLAVATLVGETKPLLISRSGRSSGTVSTSGPFVLALVAVAGVGVALLAQAVASLADDLINRRTPKKSAFNSAQYVLSLVAARAVYSGLAHVPFFSGPTTVEVRDLGPLLAGGLAMVLVNLILVAIVMSFLASFDEAQGTYLVGAPDYFTMPTEMYTLVLNYPKQVAAVFSILLSIPSVVLLLVARKHIMGGQLAEGFQIR